ncbi:MAG TPA: biotin-dependent carboxyltransferase family protein [Nitrospira sp.]|nr:biotin-dependent carboxyltransferase family protein [Nitrospira sp.]
MTRLDPAHIMVVKPGWFTTVQDMGRYGCQQYGVSVSGAMDRRSHVLANRLVGNRDDAAALELTVKGPELLFKNDTVMALTGADLTPFVDGRVMPLWTSVLVKGGGRLTFRTKRAGARCYLAIAGGIDVPMVFGSRSTHIASQIGGVKGRVLAQGDVLSGGTLSSHHREMIGRLVPEQLRPLYSTVATLRILRGPQHSSLSEQALEVLTTSPYRLTSQSDRMGYRLEGPKLTHAGMKQWISDGTAMGALQVPPDEQPILLMADRQTTGGYPKIAVVISVDLHLAGQLMPGDTINFRMTTPAEAQAVLKTEWNELDQAIPPYRAV